MIRAKQKIYLDSTVPNYVFNDEYPEKQKAAEHLFQNAKKEEIYCLRLQLHLLNYNPSIWAWVLEHQRSGRRKNCYERR